MYYSPDIDTKKIYYLKRKERLNKDFEWTKENVQNLRELNAGLSEMQNKLVEEIKEVYAVFSNLKNKMTFLVGFKVIGKISFEKTILAEYDELENLTAEQKKTYRKWDEISYYSLDELEAWQLIFDSKSCDFLPLSKTRITQHSNCWQLKLPDDEDDFLFCSYLSHFIKHNKTFSYQDLCECNAEDFSLEISVVLNHDVSEFSRFSDCLPYREDDFISQMLEDRQSVLDKGFEWNVTNIYKILEVNSWLWKKTDEMKKYMSELCDAFKKLSKTNSRFKEYSIDEQIEYQGSQANDIATLEVQKQLSRCAGFHFYHLSCSTDRPEIKDNWHDDKDLNWNFEVFRNHLSDEQQEIRFHYFMHTIFVDDGIYSFEDLVRMREEDFKVCLVIEF